MNLLILGATGSLGSIILEQALDLGHNVTVLLRNPSKLHLRHYHLHILKGEALDAHALASAMPFQHCVIYALGNPSASRPVTFFSATTKLLIEAMYANHVSRLIAVTGIGAGDSKGHGGWLYDHIIFPFITKPNYEDKDRQEALIRSSQLDWTIVRPASFTKGPLGGRLRATDQLDGITISSISRADAAAFVLDQVHTTTWLHRAPLVGY